MIGHRVQGSLASTCYDARQPQQSHHHQPIAATCRQQDFRQHSQNTNIQSLYAKAPTTLRLRLTDMTLIVMVMTVAMIFELGPISLCNHRHDNHRRGGGGGRRWKELST